MLFDLLAWLLITFTCYGWGELIFSAFAPEDEEFSLPVLAMVGIGVIGVIGYYLSLAGPLHWVSRAAIFLIPLARLVLSAAFRKKLLAHSQTIIRLRPVPDFILTLSCILLVLILGASPVIHPDTLNYHQFSVRIFQDYGSITGVVNARPDLGFQSSWFAALNIFDPRLVTGRIAFPAAGAAMVWLVLFLRGEQPPDTGQGKTKEQWYRLGLLIFCMASWTQIRLTAISASPDFLTALNVMAAFYFFSGVKRSASTDFLSAFFSFAALLTKLSAFPILLIPGAIAFEHLRSGQTKLLAGLVLPGLLMLFPLLMRSYIESGYLLFPSVQLNFFHPDWKMPADQTLLSQEYIRAYARYPINSSQTYALLKLPFSAWTKIWWKHLYVADKILLTGVAFALPLSLIFFRRYGKELLPRRRTAYCIALVGVVFWFLFGPDPRFGSGFLLSFFGLAALPFIRNSASASAIPKLSFPVIEISLAIVLAVYSVFRLVHFSGAGEWKLPAGIVNNPIDYPDCTDQVKKLMFPDLPYGGALPDSCRRFRLRGKTVGDGFAPLESAASR